ncbi:Formamidopyrimidine-DNA glycosylase [compost metagenome]
MPEIVEVEIQTEGLQDVVGDVITDVIFHKKGDKITRYQKPEQFREQLLNASIEDVFRQGKKIVFQTEQGFGPSLFLTSHLRMTGRWTIDVPEKKVGHSRLAFKLKSGRELRYSDVRVFGIMQLSTAYPGCEGADVLDGDYTDLANKAFKNKKAKGRSIKTFILDQHIWTGLGNVYANESLYEANIHPGEDAWDIVSKWDRLEGLIESVKRTLQKGYAHGGLSLKDYFHVDGTQGEAQNHLNVYKREVCNCGLPIVRDTNIGTGTTFYCPTCQIKRLSKV